MNDLSTIREQFQAIADKANHGIPAYATEETQAGSYLASYLNEIHDMALAALSRLEASAGEPVAWVAVIRYPDGDDSMAYASTREGAVQMGRERTRLVGTVVRVTPLYAHPSPSPAPVELSEADIERMARGGGVPQPTVEAVEFGHGYAWEQGVIDTLRHITKHYTLTPKQP